MSLAHTIRFVTHHPLTEKHKVSALLRFARWQVLSRLRPNGVVYSWVNGTKFRARRGQTGITGNIYTGLHEFADMAFLLHYLRPEDTFVDIGANVGSYTLLAAGSVGASAVAFEPSPSTFRHLQENVRLNRMEDRVRCLNVGVGEIVGKMRFTNGGDAIAHVVADGEQAQAVEVQIHTLDSALQGKKPRLMKIDVEGYETPVILGATNTLSGTDPMAVIMELNGMGARYGFDESQILRRMHDFGFQPYTYKPFSRTIVPLDGKDSKKGNTIFMRGSPDAIWRVHTARRYSVLGTVI